MQPRSNMKTISVALLAASLDDDDNDVIRNTSCSHRTLTLKQRSVSIYKRACGKSSKRKFEIFDGNFSNNFN